MTPRRSVEFLAATLAVWLGFTCAAVAQEPRPQIAVWEFQLDGVSKGDGRAITNRLRSELVNTRKFRVMTRDQLDTLLGEQALGQTVIDATEAIKTGKLKGIKYVVTGTIISIRNAFQMTMEKIDGQTGEITVSITPPTFRGDFLDFLDFEVPRYAAQLAGAQPTGPRAPPATAVAAPPPRAGGATTLVIFPGQFDGHGSTRLREASPELYAHVQSILAARYSQIAVAKPFAEPRKEPFLSNDFKVDILRKTIWQGAAFGLGGGQPNFRYMNTVSKKAGSDLALVFKTKSKFSLFNQGKEGNFTVFLYEVKTGKKYVRKGNWQRDRWIKDLGEGLKLALKDYRGR